MYNVARIKDKPLCRLHVSNAVETLCSDIKICKT